METKTITLEFVPIEQNDDHDRNARIDLAWALVNTKKMLFQAKFKDFIQFPSVESYVAMKKAKQGTR